MTTIRPARPEEAATLSEIERLSGERFREVGLDDVADDEPSSAEDYGEYIAANRAWVVEAEEPVGFIVVSEVDGAAHINQLSVIPALHGRGLGRALVEQAGRWAVDNGRTEVTLTTFDHVPWNRPLYEHLGFRVLTAADVGPELRAILDHEAEEGLDPAVRVAMRKSLS